MGRPNRIQGDEMTEIRYVDCDTALKQRVGKALGEVAERHIRLENVFTFLAME